MYRLTQHRSKDTVIRTGATKRWRAYWLKIAEGQKQAFGWNYTMEEV